MLVIDSLSYQEDYREVLEKNRIDDTFREALGRLTIKEREFLSDVENLDRTSSRFKWTQYLPAVAIVSRDSLFIGGIFRIVGY